LNIPSLLRPFWQTHLVNRADIVKRHLKLKFWSDFPNKEGVV
jgi:hypothetical protein